MGDLCDSSLGCDYKGFGVFDAEMSRFIDDTLPFFSAFYSDFSSGYLEDVLLEFTDRSKRQRLLLCADHQTKEANQQPNKKYLNSEFKENYSGSFSYSSQKDSMDGVSGEHMYRSASRAKEFESCLFTDKETIQDQELSASETLHSWSSSPKEPANNSKYFNLEGVDENKKRKKGEISKGLVYPFEMVKPGRVDGDVTLNDINHQILMPPTRPVKHPVGDYACRPLLSAAGTSLSGKAVIAFARLHTHARGTITIIRTRG
ncbi:hypothetical protein NMG60_11030675 [Bertholletia excelsa]